MPLPLFMQLLRLLGTPAAIIGVAHSYIFIIMAGVSATIAYNAMADFLRSMCNSAAPLVFLCLSCALNIALDILLIPHRGVAGAAIATIASQAVSAIVCAAYIWRGYRSFLPGRGEWFDTTPLRGGTLARFLAGTSDSVITANAVLNLCVSLLFFMPLGSLLLLRNALQATGHKVSSIVSSTVELVMKVAFCALAVPRWGYMGVVAI